MKQMFVLGSGLLNASKRQAILSAWMFRTILWWSVAWLVPKIGFDMIWFAALPAGLSLLFWPRGMSFFKIRAIRWALMWILALGIFTSQHLLMDQEIRLFFLLTGSLVTSILVGTLTTYFSH